MQPTETLPQSFRLKLRKTRAIKNAEGTTISYAYPAQIKNRVELYELAQVVAPNFVTSYRYRQNMELRGIDMEDLASDIAMKFKVPTAKCVCFNPVTLKGRDKCQACRGAGYIFSKPLRTMGKYGAWKALEKDIMNVLADRAKDPDMTYLDEPLNEFDEDGTSTEETKAAQLPDGPIFKEPAFAQGVVLHNLLACLPQSHRDVMDMLYLQPSQLTVREVADAMRLSKSAVSRIRIHSLNKLISYSLGQKDSNPGFSK